MARSWYTMKAANDEAEIAIYAEIGQSWWDDDAVSASSFAADLKALGTPKKIVLRLNSPGGSVFDGVTIHNLLAQHPAHVTAKIDGLAASAASLIAMAADKIEMPENAFLLIHEPRSIVLGTADDMKAAAADMERMTESFASTYASRSGQDVKDVKALMKEDRLMSATEAAELGYADELTKPVKLAASFTPRILPKATQDALAPLMAFGVTKRKKGADMATKDEAAEKARMDAEALAAAQAAKAKFPPDDEEDKKDGGDDEDEENADGTKKKKMAADATQDAVMTERKRAADIQAACALVKRPDMAADFIAKGTSLSDAVATLRDAKAGKDDTLHGRSPDAGLHQESNARSWDKAIAKVNTMVTSVAK